MNDPSVSIVPLRELPGNTNAEGEIPVKLIYSKSKVYVHPSANPADFICGYISIVEKVRRRSSSSRKFLAAGIWCAILREKERG